MLNRTEMNQSANLTDGDRFTNGTDESGWTLPSWQMQDMVRLVVLPLLFVVGAPMNLAAFSHLVASKQRGSASSTSRRMHLLKLHLNVSDLMILLVYTASQICWLITYEWLGGELLCRLVKFLHTLSFGISSNVVVCIAFDRAASVFDSTRRRRDDNGRRSALFRVELSLAVAWIAAVACALPQFWTWTTYRPFVGYTWTQCVSVYFVNEVELRKNLTLTRDTPSLTKSQYATFHVLVIFWIPAMIIAICYLHVVNWLLWQDRVLPGRFWRPSRTCTYASMAKATDADGRQTPATAPGGQRCSLAVDACRPPPPTSPKGSACSNTPLLIGRNSRAASGCYVPPILELQRVKRRAMGSSLLLVLAYIITWLPYNVIALWGLIDEDHYKTYGQRLSFLQYLIVFNSVINPFLYRTFGKRRKPINTV